MTRPDRVPGMVRGFLAALAVAVLLHGGSAAAGTVTLVADEWPPFNMAPGGERQGYMVDIAREVFEPLGFTVEYRTMSWVRALDDVMAGVHDGVIGATRSEARGLVIPEESLGVDRLVLYVRKDSQWRFEGLPSLESVRLGIVKGYGYEASIANYVSAHADNPDRIYMISGTKPLERLLGMLLLDRIDVVLDTEASLRHVAAELGVLASLRPAGRLDGAERLFIAFSPARPDARELAQDLSEGVRRLRASGRLQQILNHYGVEDWADLDAPNTGRSVDGKQ